MKNITKTSKELQHLHCSSFNKNIHIKTNYEYQLIMRCNMSNILLIDAKTIATSYDLSEIKYELNRRQAIRSNISHSLYTCNEDTLKMAIQLYNEPSIRSEREAVLQSIAEINQY